MLQGNLKTIKKLDDLLTLHYPLDKNSNNMISVYTKTYTIGNGKARLFFDEREDIGTIKFKGGDLK